jgi:antitoxin (DNA-binding transcriptional repressor) of toxin-antitoxin stability system
MPARRFVSDSGAVTRGLRQGRAYTLTLNGEPLARMTPIRRRRAIPKGEVFAVFATAPVVDRTSCALIWIRTSARISVIRMKGPACDRA